MTNVKGVFVPVMLYSNTPLYDQIKEVIGEIQQDDLICFGLVKTSDGTIIDMSAMVERKDKLTLRSMDFVVRTVQKFQMQGGEYQLAFCKRNT